MKLKTYIEYSIFYSKWLLLPFYYKLCFTLLTLTYHFLYEGHLDNADLIATLEDIDVVMIANLVKMIITGSYNSFISKSTLLEGEHISSGALKVKMSTYIMGVSSIHLLQTFINAESLTIDVIYKQILIHGVFIITSIVLSVIDYLHSKSEHKH